MRSLKFWITACVVLLLCGVLILTDKAAKDRAEASVFFMETLSNRHVDETIQLDGKKYRVQGSIVHSIDGQPISAQTKFEALRIAYALSLARRAPLFSLEGTDVETLSSAIDRLESTRDLLAETAEKPDDAERIRAALYPVRFLRSAVSLEKKRVAFLASGAPRDERAYYIALKSTLRAFEDDLSRYRAAFTELMPSSEEIRYALPFGSITSRSIVATLDALEDRVRNANEKLSRRETCLAGNVEECNHLDLAIPSSLSGEPAPMDSSILPPLVKEVLSLRAEAIDNATDGATQTVIELSRKTCPPNAEGPHYITPGPQGLRHGPASFLASDLFFYQTADFRDIPAATMMRYFAEKSVSLVFIPTTAFYTCPETGSDIGLMGAIIAVADFAKKNPSLAPVEASRMFSEPPVIREFAARTFVHEALARTTPDTDAWRELVALTLMLENRSANFDALVKEVASFGESDVRMKNAGMPVNITPQYLFLARSGFLALFMGHNRSVVGDESMSPLSRAVEPNPLVYQWSDIRSRIPKDAVVHDLRFFITSHVSPETIGAE